MNAGRLEHNQLSYWLRPKAAPGSVNAASLALTAAVMVHPALSAAVLLFRYEKNSAWLILGGMAAGMVLPTVNLNVWPRI